MTRRFATLTLVVLTAFNCSDDDSFQKESFVGKWTVSEVFYDHEVKTEWVGTHLVIEQNETDSGLYSMPDTKYDSIWGSHGSWSKFSPEFLILDDTLTVTFYAENEKLAIVKRLPWTERPCIVNKPCTLVVTGYWMFKFDKDH